MKFIAKSAFIKENIMDKVNKGSDGIEIQLLNPKNEICTCSDYRIENYLRNCNIVSIHTPLDNKTDCNYNIETPEGQKELVKSLVLADKFSQFYGQRMNVVCHMELSIKQQKELGIYEKVKDFLCENLDKYKNIDISLENVTIRHSGVYDNTILVREINKENFGTTLDICHALMSKSITGFLTDKGKCESNYYKYETLTNAFRYNSGVLKWVHLNNAANFGQGYGVGKGHGCIFNKDNINDMNTLVKVLNYVKDEKLENICIEVYEEDYLNSQNFLQTKILCESILEKNNIYKFTA